MARGIEVVEAEKKSADKVVLSEPEMGRYYLPDLTPIYIGGLLEDAETLKGSGKLRAENGYGFL